MKRILIFTILSYCGIAVAGSQTFEEDWAAYTAALKARKGGYTVGVQVSAVDTDGKPDAALSSEGTVKIWGANYYYSSFREMHFLVTPDWYIFIDDTHKKILLKALKNMKKKPESIQNPVPASARAEKKDGGYFFKLPGNGSCRVVFSPEGMLMRVVYENTGGLKRTDILYTYRESDFSKEDFDENRYIRKEKNEWKPQAAFSGYKIIMN